MDIFRKCSNQKSRNHTLQPLNLREKRQDKDGQVHCEEIRTIFFTPTQLRTWLLTEMVDVMFKKNSARVFVKGELFFIDGILIFPNCEYS